MQALIWPGMQLQLLTTREPDLSQLAVAIAAMERVLAEASSDPEGLVGVEIAA